MGEKMDVSGALVVENYYYSTCFQCDWAGSKTSSEVDALSELDRHLEKSHPSIWYLLKRNKLLEQVAEIAFELILDTEALVINIDGDKFCFACDERLVDGKHDENCLSAVMMKLKKELEGDGK